MNKSNIVKEPADFAALQEALISVLLRPEFSAWEPTAGELHKLARSLYNSFAKRGIQLIINPKTPVKHEKSKSSV